LPKWLSSIIVSLNSCLENRGHSIKFAWGKLLRKAVLIGLFSVELYNKWCYDLAKQLSHYLYFFSVLLFSRLTIQEWSMRKYHVTKCHRVTGLQVTVRWHYITESYRNHRKVVYRLYSSCINSIENLMGTLSSFLCQLRLGEWLSHPG